MNSITDQRTGDRRESGPDVERLRMSVGAVVSAIMFIAGLLTTYFASVNTVNARVSVVESQQQSDKARLERIENKVDRLLER